MKSTSFVFAVILALVFAIPGYSGGDEINGKKINQNTIKSLLIGLESENIGLKTSSAYLLGELKIHEAVIPLMKVLKTCNCDEARIAAALALYKIGTPLAIFAVKQAGIFDESERVSRMANNFYSDYLRNKTINNGTFDPLFVKR